MKKVKILELQDPVIKRNENKQNTLECMWKVLQYLQPKLLFNYVNFMWKFSYVKRVFFTCDVVKKPKYLPNEEILKITVQYIIIDF